MQWLWDSAIKVDRWQHPTTWQAARFAVPDITCCLCLEFYECTLYCYHHHNHVNDTQICSYVKLYYTIRYCFKSCIQEKQLLMKQVSFLTLNAMIL